MAIYAISCTYTCSATDVVEFPAGKTWDDVENWYVKWNILHVQFKGAKEWIEIGMVLDLTDSIDMKHPGSVQIQPCDENGEPDYDAAPVAEIG